MATESVSAYTYQMAQMRISQLELENKMLKEQLKAHELHNVSITATPQLQEAPAAVPALVIEEGAEGDLQALRTKAMAERDAASAKFRTLMDKHQKLLNEGSDEDTSTEDSFSLPSPLNSQETDISLDSPTFTPLNTQ